MKLFYSPASPFARKVRVLAIELGIEDRIEVVDVNPWSDETLRAVNPFCQVPALMMPDGSGIYDSRVICDFLDEVGGRRAFPMGGADRVLALKQQALGDGICDGAVRRLRESLRKEGDRHLDMMFRITRAMGAALDVLEADAQGLMGPFGIGPICVAVTLGYLDFRMPQDHWRQGRPQLAGWYDAVSERPSMIATAPPDMPVPT